MPANFSIKFIINEKTQTRVLRLTHIVTDFTLTKGNFSVTFPDGSTRIKTDFNSPDITSPGAYIDVPAIVDNSNNVITGNYQVSFVAINSSLVEYSALITFDFNWTKPTNSILNMSDVLIPEVKFKDNASYSPIGSFTGTLSRTFSAAFPTTSEASGGSVSTVSSNTIDLVNSGKYYDGTYTPSSDVTVNYTHSSESRLTIQYIELFTKTFLIKECPTQTELVVKINNYRALIDAYKDKNDTQFNILSEQYDLVIALYTHLITRYETSTQDGSEPILRELLSILEPYDTSYTPQLTRMLPFELASTGSNSFSISDGTNTDSIPLGSTITVSSGNPALTIGVSNNLITYTPTFGTTTNTFAQGNDSRFHNAVTIGTANGLSLASQVLSLASATTSTSGAMSASDKAKLDGIAAGANTGTVTSIGISVPSAFAVSNSPVTTSGTINISATGNPLQYITGAGALATLNTGVVPENGSLYFTNARSRGAISVSGSLSYNSTTGVISYTTPSETDPVFVASVAYGITSTNITNWNTAYGWGNHASAGYLTSINSSQVTTALGYTPENAANKGVANGYASLDSGGLVPSTQLPSYVDDVLEYADLASLPATGTTGKIYVTLDTNKIYRWSGTVYVEISSSAGGGGTWGSITGTLSNQTDLQSALNAKQNQLNGTGFVKASGTTITYDNSTYLTTSAAASTYVPYTGANANVSLGEYGLTAGYLAFDTTPTGTPTGIGTMYWDAANRTVALIDGDGDTTLQIGQEQRTLVHNNTGSTLTDGQVVYITGSTGQLPSVSLASAASETTSAATLGVVTETIAHGADGFITTSGVVNGLNTLAFNEGDLIWLSATAGQFTTTKPISPNHLVLIGYVLKKAGGNGSIIVKIQNTQELEESSDVLFTSLTNNDGMFWDSATSLWKNKTIAAVLGYTPYSSANPSNYIALTALSSTATGLTYTNTTGVFSLTSGYVIPTTTEESNWNTAYTNRITSLTTTGSSGSASISANTLNIPTYTLSGLGGVPISRTITINGTTLNLSEDRSFSVPTYTRSEQIFTTTSGQTTFTISGGYTVGLIDVYVNGVKYAPSDFTAVNGTTIAISGLIIGDVVSTITYTSATFASSQQMVFLKRDTYALMIADGTPTINTLYTITNDESKSYTRSTYLWKTDGNREWIASTSDN